MPNYDYNPSSVQSTFEIFDKSTAEVIFGTPKSFVVKVGDDVKNYGVRIPFTVAEGPYAGKKGIQNCYLHNDGSQSMTKQLHMAVFGYDRTSEQEKKFDVDTISADWSIDPENGTVGEQWKKIDGARAIADFDVGKNRQTGEPQQQIKWRPLSSQNK